MRCAWRSSWMRGTPGRLGRRPRPPLENSGEMCCCSTFGMATRSRGRSRRRRRGASALLVFPGRVLDPHARRIAQLAAQSRLPAMYAFRVYVEAGGLISYGADLIANNRRAAAFVDKILKGAKPDDLPFEQPSKFELVINHKTAKALGLTIPPSLLARADQVIE